MTGRRGRGRAWPFAGALANKTLAVWCRQGGIAAWAVTWSNNRQVTLQEGGLYCKIGTYAGSHLGFFVCRRWQPHFGNGVRKPPRVRFCPFPLHRRTARCHLTVFQGRSSRGRCWCNCGPGRLVVLTDRSWFACSIFWLVTAPADPTKEKTFEKLQGATRDVATVHKWDLPDLKARPQPLSLDPLESARQLGLGHRLALSTR